MKSSPIDDFREAAEKLYCLLDLRRRAAGTKLVRSEQEFAEFECPAVRGALNYCQMIKGATNGKVMKAKAENFLCRSGAKALGLDHDDSGNCEGQNWKRLGLYEANLCQTVRNDTVYLEEDSFGVIVGELTQMAGINAIPSTVTIICNPYNAMRIIQGYAHYFGYPKNISLIGNQAICSECAARPIANDDINISMLCIGTRHRTGWGDDEMAIGVPISKFSRIVDGIYQTVNQMESNENKQLIERKFAAANLPITIRYNYNYYLDCR